MLSNEARHALQGTLFSFSFSKLPSSNIPNLISKSAGCSWAPPGGRRTHPLVRQSVKRGRKQKQANTESPNLSLEWALKSYHCLVIHQTSQHQQNGFGGSPNLSVLKRFLPLVWLILNWSLGQRKWTDVCLINIVSDDGQPMGHYYFLPLFFKHWMITASYQKISFFVISFNGELQ